jgi:hypothetical protein
VKTKIIAADFTRTDIYDAIARELSGLDIGVLGEKSYLNENYFKRCFIANV